MVECVTGSPRPEGEKTFSGCWKTMLVRWSDKCKCMIIALEVDCNSPDLPKELVGELTSKLAGLKYLKSCTIKKTGNRGQKKDENADDSKSDSKVSDILENVEECFIKTTTNTKT